jgi:ArsR family transcriptional regulator
MLREDTVERAAEVFKAMGDRTRLSILKTLFKGEQCVTDLAKLLSMDAPRVSFHLTRLRFAGLVTDERRGQRVAYRLNPSVCNSDSQGKTKINLGDCIIQFEPDSPAS